MSLANDVPDWTPAGQPRPMNYFTSKVALGGGSPVSLIAGVAGKSLYLWSVSVSTNGANGVSVEDTNGAAMCFYNVPAGSELPQTYPLFGLQLPVDVGLQADAIVAGDVWVTVVYAVS